MIRVVLPEPLCVLARIDREVAVHVPGRRHPTRRARCAGSQASRASRHHPRPRHPTAARVSPVLRLRVGPVARGAGCAVAGGGVGRAGAVPRGGSDGGGLREPYKGQTMAKTKDQKKGIFCPRSVRMVRAASRTRRPSSPCCGSSRARRTTGFRTCTSTSQLARSSTSTSRNGAERALERAIRFCTSAFHGEADGLFVGEGRGNRLNLNQLGERLDGKCRGRIIHFGSCATVDVPDHALDAFLRRTGALAVFGYMADVEWLESAAFDLLVLGSEIPSFYHIDRQGNPEWTRDISHLEV